MRQDEVGFPHLRVPPHNIDAEHAVLGALLNAPACIDAVQGTLRAEHFYSRDHRSIYDTICALANDNRAIDIVSVSERGKHDLAYLNQLAMSVVSAKNITSHADIVREHWMRRQAIAACDKASSDAFGQDASAAAICSAAQEALAKIVEGAHGNEPEHMRGIIARQIDRIERRSNGDDVVYATGLVDLDRLLTGGLRPGRVYTFGARPSMGKTTLALTIARNIAQAHPALFLSQEAPRDQIADAMIAALGNLPLDNVLRPDPNAHETWARIAEGAERAGQLKLMIDDTPSLRVSDVRAKALAARRALGGLAAVVVDYIQLMSGDGENRATQLGAIANGLKGLALSLDVPIVVLAQCNREADRKPEGADSMADLNESGGIEAASDFVALLHREHVRTPDHRLKDYAQLRVPKNRIGKTGRVDLFFNGERQYFASWSGPAPVMPKKSGGYVDSGIA